MKRALNMAQAGEESRSRTLRDATRLSHRAGLRAADRAPHGDGPVPLEVPCLVCGEPLAKGESLYDSIGGLWIEYHSYGPCRLAFRRVMRAEVKRIASAQGWHAPEEWAEDDPLLEHVQRARECPARQQGLDTGSALGGLFEEPEA